MALAVLGLLMACGPAWAPAHAPAIPCPAISQSDFDAAVADGAARARATIGADGVVSMETGPGVVHCSTGPAANRVCRRPDDLVIRYRLGDGSDRLVRVPAGAQYRFRLAARPTTCEILTPP